MRAELILVVTLARSIANTRKEAVMINDTPPNDTEILDSVGNGIDPTDLINILAKKYGKKDVIEGLQRAIEREKIALDSNGMVVAARVFAEAA